ncbi:hypothetical protein M2137_002389 [Parabacteroides sp. PFB2-10]|nr:hypothetical protein [Parabacteroides sp. PFB2-10]
MKLHFVDWNKKKKERPVQIRNAGLFVGKNSYLCSYILL